MDSMDSVRQFCTHNTVYLVPRNRCSYPGSYMSNVGGAGKSNIELCDLKLEQGRHGNKTNPSQSGHKYE